MARIRTFHQFAASPENAGGIRATLAVNAVKNRVPIRFRFTCHFRNATAGQAQNLLHVIGVLQPAAGPLAASDGGGDCGLSDGRWISMQRPAAVADVAWVLEVAVVGLVNFPEAAGGLLDTALIVEWETAARAAKLLE